ncbi:ATP-binding cassette domain-containing protein [Halobacillus yeomjeoni]|uniref:ATP-binding cassette domain-containing protein n=1 Tax=Halobacillus yeomjeoni TaxID=311194 RepID=A0A931HVL5_9BACI|nr:ATP-binding cassette domain-containing protein [Halobacillus yeomjeoni]MBH0230226.1 ATP-binding cassette domain-containing protein [Halobacillus yeomjeoni]
MLKANFSKQLDRFPLNVNINLGNEIAVLSGPSGSGKTTTLNCIAGLQHPDDGFIQLGGNVLFKGKQKPAPVQNRKVGYVFQNYALFPHMTVKKNIEYGAKDASLTSQLIDAVGIDHLMNKYPAQISGGEKQRVALARALATQPNLLLLDEPFSSLDHQTKVQCQQELVRLHKLWKIPILLVTHDRHEAESLGHRILHIEKGVLKEDK